MVGHKKKVTKAMVKKAYQLYQRALHLQGELYDFKDMLTARSMDYESNLIEDGAFEMDLTWSNANKVFTRFKAQFEKPATS